MTMNPSEFLSELDSHGIYDARKMADAWRKETGMEPCWHATPTKQLKQAIKERGLGGWIDPTVSSGVSGFGLATAVANHLVPERVCRGFSGRGSIFREAIEHLAAAGY